MLVQMFGSSRVSQWESVPKSRLPVGLELFPGMCVHLDKIFIFQCLKMFLDQRRKDDPALAYEYFLYAFEGYLSLKMSSHIDRIQTFL